MIERLRASSRRAQAFMSASACEPLLRSIGIMPAFQAYQPKNGIHINSRFMMKAASGKISSSANVSHSD